MNKETKYIYSEDGSVDIELTLEANLLKAYLESDLYKKIMGRVDDHVISGVIEDKQDAL